MRRRRMACTLVMRRSAAARVRIATNRDPGRSSRGAADMSASSTEATSAAEVPNRTAAQGSGDNGHVPHLSLGERAARGKAERAEVSRGLHGEWVAPPARRDPVELLEEQAASRVPELVPIRYGRMLVSPFTFYRGAALVMAADLAATPRSGITVQLCGDAHLSNFGVFGTPERQMIFDINDFDETLPGPWEWDVKRLATSFEILGRERGFSRADRRAIVIASVREYRTVMREAAALPTLAAWYAHTN